MAELIFVFFLFLTFDIIVIGMITQSPLQNHNHRIPLNTRNHYEDYFKKIIYIAGSTLVYSTAALAVDQIKLENTYSKDESISFSCEEAAEFIKSNCTTILTATQSTGRLLYRGSTNGIDTAMLTETEFDLLNKETYSSPIVADYFKYLNIEIQTNYMLTPSNGHLATSDIISASNWGQPVSVWPLDEGFHYVWLRNELNWWNPDWANPQSLSKGPTFWRSASLRKEFIRDELRYDNGLEAALVNNHEVLFGNINLNNSNNKYLIVPLKYESKLCKLLNIVPFSNKIKVARSQNQMELNGKIGRRIDPLLKQGLY